MYLQTYAKINAPPVLGHDFLLFPITPRAVASSTDRNAKPNTVQIPRFIVSHDPEGAASFIPHMDHFYDNSLQTGLMRDMAIDLELLGEHLVLLGNQVGINVG